MRRVPTALAVIAVLAASCSTPSGAPRSAGSSPTEAASPGPSPSPDDRPEPFTPDPTARLPRRPEILATRLTRVTDELATSIAAWKENGGLAARPPRIVVLQALYQQRAHRLLARNRPLARRVIPRLGPGRRFRTAALVHAGRRLRSLVRPVSPTTRFRTQRPETAGALLRYYRKAERRFSVDWEVLAAVNYVETKFGRVRSPSYAGAQGPMQFLPSTWDAYGLGGNVHDPHDAILGAANYLRASGAPGNYRKALYAYNPVDAYVDATLIYARHIRRHPHHYPALYNWQVFVITTEGEVRLTGPGAR